MFFSDDLIEVMINESGRPSNRFSLRLSSQLMRGLVRLYERKVSVFLGDLCMINAHVFKSTNKKFVIHETVQHDRPLPQLPRLPAEDAQETENEPRVEELIQNSGNVVRNIQDITLKEAAIPEFQLPPNDGFGEEHPDQVLQHLGDRTVEVMLEQPDVSAVQHSGLEPHDSTDKSHDKSRLAPHDAPLMERISEHDVTIFRKSTAQEVPPTEEFEKDIPEIPEIPLPDLNVPPELPAPPPEMQVSEASPEVSAQELPKEVLEPSTSRKQPVEIELEELEVQPTSRKRRGRAGLIIDKKIRLSANYLRSRIDNPNVELRCEDSWDDIADIRVPFAVYRTRPAQAGPRLPSRMADALTRMFQRNLAFAPLVPRDTELEERDNTRYSERKNRNSDAWKSVEILLKYFKELKFYVSKLERQVQIVQQQMDNFTKELSGSGLRNIEMEQLRQRRTRSVLEKIVEEPEGQEITQEQAQVQPPTLEQPAEVDISKLDVTAGDALNLTEQALYVTERDQNVTRRDPFASEQRQSVLEPMDISDLPTQKLETLSQQARKRATEYVAETSPKRQRSVGYVSFRQSQQQADKEFAYEQDKENIPPESANQQQPQATETARSVTAMLQEAGLAEIQPLREVEQVIETQTRPRRDGSESSETPLGSLDRTKVSLGDSVKTTDSQRFIRNQWGIEGTMVKILANIKAGMRPVTVEQLIAKGPIIPGYKGIIAARCFTSILKLKQHEFIKIEKDSDTLKIQDITLGPRFDGI